MGLEYFKYLFVADNSVLSNQFETEISHVTRYKKLFWLINRVEFMATFWILQYSDLIVPSKRYNTVLLELETEIDNLSYSVPLSYLFEG